MPTDRDQTYSSPVRGNLEASGRSVDEIIARAQQEIARVAAGREHSITAVELTPLLIEFGGEIPVWNATIEFRIEDHPSPDDLADLSYDRETISGD